MRLQYIKEVEAVIILIHPELERLVYSYGIGKNKRLVYIICPVRAINPYHKELVESIPDEEYVFLYVRYYNTLRIPKKLITHRIFNQCLIRNDVFVLRENDLLNFSYFKIVYNLALDYLKINKNRNG